MSSKIPIVKQMAWISIIPHLLVMGIIILIWYQFDRVNFILYGAINYLIISQLLRRIITKQHNIGIAKVKNEQFEEALIPFKTSFAFFKKYDWVDKYRYLTLLTSSRMSYKEMALNNIAFCYSQIGKGKLAKEYYSQTLNEFPDSQMAKIGLRMLNSITDLKEDGKQLKNNLK